VFFSSRLQWFRNRLQWVSNRLQWFTTDKSGLGTDYSDLGKAVDVAHLALFIWRLTLTVGLGEGKGCLSLKQYNTQLSSFLF
jgi:CTP-dependent riboflavin kinase